MANERKLDWASGGWIIAFAIVMMLGVVAWRVPHWRASDEGGAIGIVHRETGILEEGSAANGFGELAKVQHNMAPLMHANMR